MFRPARRDALRGRAVHRLAALRDATPRPERHSTGMTINEYFAVRGSGLSDKDAKIIGPEIVRLEKHGQSTTRGVYEAARDKQSPLHRYVFDCSRKDAADRYYLTRAGHLLRSVQIEVRVAKEPGAEPMPRRMRAFYPVALDDVEDEEAKPERHYVSIQTVLESRDYSAQVWREGLRYLQLFRSRFRELDDVFGPVLRAIDETEARLAEDAA